MENIAIVVNLKSRQAKKFHEYLKSLDTQIHYQVFQIPSNQLSETLEKCKKKFKLILVGGGDGTIRTAAQHLINTNIALGVIPLGTMNHFVQENDLPFTPEEIKNALDHNNTKYVDTAEVNGISFINNASIGFYPGLVERRNYYSRYINKWLAYIPSFFLNIKNFKRLQINLQYEDKKIIFNTSFLLISNNIYSIDFPTKLKRESIEQGILGLYYNIAEKKYSRHWVKPQLLTIDKTNKIINVDSNKKLISVALDGEVMKLKLPLAYKSQPKSLKILIK